MQKVGTYEYIRENRPEVGILILVIFLQSKLVKYHTFFSIKIMTNLELND